MTDPVIRFGEKVHVLSKRTFGDFDIERLQTIAVSSDKGALETLAIELNCKLTAEEVRQEVSYKVTGTCKLI